MRLRALTGVLGSWKAQLESSLAEYDRWFAVRVDFVMSDLGHRVTDSGLQLKEQ